MSDTPIDRALESKKSTRFPEFMLDRIERFHEEYNAAIEETPMDEDATDIFLLDSHSDAHRRVIDFGLAMWAQDSIPFGFAFDPELESGEDGAEARCPGCGEDDLMKLRIGVSDADNTMEFGSVKCFSCEKKSPLKDVLVFPPDSNFGF